MGAFVDLLVRSVPIIIGGGAVQFAIFLMRRRGELRQLDSAAKKTDVEGDAIVVASAAQSLALAGQIRDLAAARASEVEQELVKVRARLAEAEAEIVLLRREVQKLKGAAAEEKSGGLASP